MCKRYRVDHHSTTQRRQHAEHEHDTGDRGCAGQAHRGDPAKPWFEGQRKRARVVRRAKDYIKLRRGLGGAECSSLGRASSSVVLVLSRSQHRVSLTRATSSACTTA